MGLAHDVRRAVLARLKAEVPGATGIATVGIYADPPQNMSLPAITLDRVFDEPDDLLSEHQSRITVTLTMWSAARGPKQAETLRDAVRGALHDRDLDLASGGVVMCRYVRGDVTRDGDGVTYMGSVIIQILAEHEET